MASGNATAFAAAVRASAYASYSIFRPEAQFSAEAATDAIRAAAYALSDSRQISDFGSEPTSHIYTFVFDAWKSDIKLISDGRTASDMLKIPLWPETKTPAYVAKLWNSLKIELNDDNWSVWTDWYDQLLDGTYEFIEEIEIGDPENGKYGRVTFPPEMYNNPKELNAALRKVIDDYWAKQTEQDASAETFDVNEDGKIFSTTVSKGLGLTVNPEQEEWYSELREAVASALQKSPNELGAAKGPLEKLSDALPENMSEARVPRLWRRANNLRRTLAKHERAKASNDEFQFDKLPDDIADDLEDIVGSYNNLLIGDQGLSQADIDGRSPAETGEIIESFKIIDPAIEMAINDNIAIGEASEILSDLLDNTKDEVGIQNRIMGRMQIEQDHKTRLNFARMLVKTARDASVKMTQTARAASIKIIQEVEPTREHFVRFYGPGAIVLNIIVLQGQNLLPFIATWLGAGVAGIFTRSIKNIEDKTQK